MYIFLKDSVPDNMSPLVAAHASLACYLKYETNKHMIKWLDKSFRKVVCRVSDEEFEQLKQEVDYNITTESALDGIEVAITFCPKPLFPVYFKKFNLWSTKK